MTQEIKFLLITGIATVGIIIAAIFFLGSNNVSQSNPNPNKVDEKILIKSDSNKIGSESAKVRLVEFGDYQCPACGLAHPIVKRITDNYKDKILFVFRNFPLSQHQNAQVAAEAAEAAGAQGKYWEMHDMLYENQDKWSDSNSPVDIFAEYAKKLNIDINKFKQDITSNKFAEKINIDQSDGSNVGVNFTPTFYLNGEKIVGSNSFADITKKIDTLLK